MKKILIVDDSPIARLEVSTILEKAGYTVITAENGEEGFKQFSSNEDIKLALVDVNMPVMSGIELAKKIKETKSGRDIPIIGVSADGTASTKKKGMEAGIIGWVVKPIHHEPFVAVIKQLIGDPN